MFKGLISRRTVSMKTQPRAYFVCFRGGCHKPWLPVRSDGHFTADHNWSRPFLPPLLVTMYPSRMPYTKC